MGASATQERSLRNARPRAAAPAREENVQQRAAALARKVKIQQRGRDISKEREDAAKGRDISEGWRARRCESRRVSIPMGLCKRHGSVSDPRAVPEERSPEGSSDSEGRKIQQRAAALARIVKVQQRAGPSAR